MSEPAKAINFSEAQVSAKYESAETTVQNRKHWSMADALSADSVGNAEVRHLLRNRSRYTVRNNSYARGIVSFIGLDVVGSGPQPQVNTGDKERDSKIEKAWAMHARRMNLAEKLRSVVECDDASGETFIVRKSRKQDIDWQVYEPEMCQATTWARTDDRYYDGIHYDEDGYPVQYDILRYHPGDSIVGVLGKTEYDTLSADVVYHFYDVERPGQRRGIPSLVPALELFEELRRYSRAVLSAAETAASIAGALESNAPDQFTPSSSAFQELELPRRTIMQLPSGWSFKQITAEQPTTGHNDYVNSVLREITRCLNLPLTLATLDSSGANLSAAYLDQQTWFKVVSMRRDKVGLLLDWMFRDFLVWYELADKGELDEIEFSWRWPELTEHADPSKVASGETLRLQYGLDNIPRMYARRGMDWEAEQEASAKSLGIPVAEYRKRLADKIFTNGNGAEPASADNPNAADRKPADRQG